MLNWMRYGLLSIVPLVLLCITSAETNHRARCGDGVQRHVIEGIVGPDAAVFDPAPPGIPSGQQGISRRSAHRMREMGIRKTHALFSRPIDIGAFEP